MLTYMLFAHAEPSAVMLAQAMSVLLMYSDVTENEREGGRERE